MTTTSKADSMVRPPGLAGMHVRPHRATTRDDDRSLVSEPVRVVLVGRTGLDMQLRLDPAIELRRVPTTVHAIGEAAEPRTTPAAERMTVIVGPDADPGTQIGDFVRNLRLVHPGARVLKLVEATGGPETLGEYDGAIQTGVTPEDLRRLVREVHAAGQHADAVADAATMRAPEPPPVSVVRSVEPQEPLATSAESHSAVRADVADESALVQAMLVGRDMTLPALDVIRARTGRTDIAFVPAGSSLAEGAAGTAVVEHQGIQFGWLTSVRGTSAELVPHAAWLGLWLSLRQQHEELRHAAFTDDLTTAWNRRYGDRFLNQAIAQASANRQSVTVLYFDIDNFKQYNDKYGHAAGDEILRETVRLLTSVIRPTDRVCRIGGDEFIVIFHEPTGPREPGSRPPANIAEIAHRFQRQVCEHRFPKLAEQAPGTLTISGGLATFPWDGRTAQELIDRADQLAMQSKLQGKNVIKLGPGAMRVCGQE